MKKYNQHTKGQSYKLFSWVESNKQTVMGSTDAETAELASEALGFPVTDNNIVGARNELGLKKSVGRPANDRLASLEARISRIESELGLS